MSLSRTLRDRRHAGLLARSRDGRPEAFRRLYRELHPPVARYLAVRLPDPEDAADLTAKVFHRFLERLADYDAHRGSVMAWLLTMARRALIDHYRTRKTAVPIDELAESLAGTLPDPLDALIRDEDARRVRALLDKQPAQVREILALRYDQGLRYKEIAVLLDLREEALRQKVSRALREMRTQLEENPEEEGEVDYAV
jgi:RNA polymerase sigma-70 factor (ECF subfamily)